MKAFFKPSVQVIKLDCNDIIATSVTTNDVVGNRQALSRRWHGRGDVGDED